MWISKGVGGSVYVYSLVMVSLIMLIAVVTSRLAFIKEGMEEAGALALIEEIEEDGLYNQLVHGLKLGERGIKEWNGLEVTREYRRYKVRASVENSGVCQIEILGRQRVLTKYIHVIPASSVFYFKDEPIVISGENWRTYFGGPVYGRKVTFDFGQGGILLGIQTGSWMPYFISGEPYGVIGKGQLVILGLGGKRADREITNVINQDGILDQGYSGKVFGRGDYRVDRLFVPKGRNISWDGSENKVAILNPYLNHKERLGTASGYEGEVIKFRGRSGILGGKLYFVPMGIGGKFRDGDLIDSKSFIDSVNVPQSYDVLEDGIRMKPTLNEVSLRLSRDSILSSSKVSLANGSWTALPVGRGVIEVKFDGVPTPFEYDWERRVVRVGELPGVKPVFRSDGRKTKFDIREFGALKDLGLIFEDGKKLEYSLGSVAGGGTEIIFSRAPRYGALISVLSELPRMQIRREGLSRGVDVYGDRQVLARELDLSQVGAGSYFVGEQDVLIKGRLRGDLCLSAKGDVYLGGVTNQSGDSVYIDCRYLFVTRDFDGKVFGRCVVKVRDQRVRSLGMAPMELNGSFIFERGMGAGEKRVPEISEDPLGFSEVKVKYDDSFVKDAFEAVWFYRSL